MKIVKVRKVKTPSRGTSKSAGIDFYMPEDKEILIYPEDSRKIYSGIFAKVPEGMVLVFFNKSSVAADKNLIVGACVVDEDYQGEIIIHLFNRDPQRIAVLRPGDKIVQGLLLPADYQEIEELETLEDLFPSPTERGAGGFGSTSKK